MKKLKIGKWVNIITGPILSLVAFLLTYYLDPLNFSDNSPLSALPAFFIAIIILLISHYILTSVEIEKNTIYSDKIYEAVKDYLHVTKVGSPDTAIDYVNSKMPDLREVKNTSFNILDEEERSEEKLYGTKTYSNSMKLIGTYASKDLIWKDIGGHRSIDRFRKIDEISLEKAKGGNHNYKYKVSSTTDLQINFIILEFKKGEREVLFNWDFRSMGQDPTVLLSRDRNIVEMFYVQFEHLWRNSSIDHDKIETKSTSKK